MDYGLEYGKETLEICEYAVEKGSRVLIIDDLLAALGAAHASTVLVTKSHHYGLGLRAGV